MYNNEYKVLIVDDNAKNIQVLASLLSEKEYDVDYAQSGTDALDLLASEDFDLILLDIMMPEMDGFEVCRRIKKDSNKNEIPIIFLTAKTDTESIQKAFNIGGIDYVNKPFRSDELLARVKTHAELKESKDKLKMLNKRLEEKVLERTAELQKANEKLLELDSAKSQFLNMVSHEIRTPLNGILGGLSLVKEFGLSDDPEAYIDILDQSATRLEEFSGKALDISQFNLYGKKVLGLEKTNVIQIISNVIADLENEWKSKEIIITKTFNIESEVINVDPKYFYKCIHYIIHNAISFTPQQGIVSVDVTNQDKLLIVEIKDEGTGFEKGFLIENIKPFVTKKHDDGNTGLSLFLSNQIVNAHGGTIENGNNVNKGAYVKIVIPGYLPG